MTSVARKPRRGSENRQRPLLAAFRCTPQEMARIKSLAAVERKPVAVYLRDSVAAVERVRALHKMMLSEYGGPAYCTEDSARWPCPTIRALEGEQ